MAAPSFVAAGTGALWQSGAAVACTLAGTTAGNIIFLHICHDGDAAGDHALSSLSNVENLAGTDNAMTAISAESGGLFPGRVGALNEARQWLWIGRSLGGTVSVSVSNGSGDDMYFRLYEFSGANTGTTLADVIENGTAGNASRENGTSATINDCGVTTLGADRLALNFIAVNDDNQAGFDTEAFTGMSGGTWVCGGAYGSSTGTDGSIGLQYATMASAGTINGGSLTMAASDPWGTIGFALIGTTSATKSPPFAQGFNSNMLR